MLRGSLCCWQGPGEFPAQQIKHLGENFGISILWSQLTPYHFFFFLNNTPPETENQRTYGYLLTSILTSRAGQQVLTDSETVTEPPTGNPDIHTNLYLRSTQHGEACIPKIHLWSYSPVRNHSKDMPTKGPNGQSFREFISFKWAHSTSQS